MEIIAKISKGSLMDQIYVPKKRSGLETGSYVVISPLSKNHITTTQKPYFYGIKEIAPIKLNIIQKIFNTVDSLIKEYQNIIITGSFLNEGFKFNDIDIIIVKENKVNERELKDKIQSLTGILPHIIIIDNESLKRGLETDPLYNLMLSCCVSSHRIIYNIKRKFDYKVLDLHLLKSKPLIENFDILDGEQKYYLTRNLISIKLFIENKKLTPSVTDTEIIKIFNLQDIEQLKNNMLNKKDFIDIYKKAYKKTQEAIFSLIKNGSKQK